MGQSREIKGLLASVGTFLAMGAAVAQSPPSTLAPLRQAPPPPTALTSAPNAQTARIFSVAGHRLAISRGFVRPFRRNFGFRHGFAIRRNFVTGGWWPYYYDYSPTGAYGDMYTTSYPETGGFVAEPTPVCHRSEEIVRVPAEGGGTRQIKIIRCP